MVVRVRVRVIFIVGGVVRSQAPVSKKIT